MWPWHHSGNCFSKTMCCTNHYQVHSHSIMLFFMTMLMVFLMSMVFLMPMVIFMPMVFFMSMVFMMTMVFVVFMGMQDVVIDEHVRHARGHRSYNHALSLHTKMHQKHGGGHVATVTVAVGTPGQGTQHASNTCGEEHRENVVKIGYINMGQVTKVWLSCYLVLLSFDSKTR